MHSKKILTLFILFSSSLCLIAQSVTSLNLKIPTDLYFAKDPASGKSIRFNVQTKLDAISMLSSDNRNSEGIGPGQHRTMGKGRKSFLMAIPMLYNVISAAGSGNYLFGKDGGEGDVDDAVVTIAFNNAAGSPELDSKGPPILLKIATPEILTVNSTNVGTAVSSQKYLKVEPDRSMSTTISITREDRRGHVMICIFNAKNGFLLGLLNPKQNATESFTTTKDVYVIPMIKPDKSLGGAGVDQILFAVGDPKTNGSASAEEE
ncbi:MAG: hypothetical protein IPF93_25450 [Saprospiraceae bacterium]|nr:hypothetical protein [Saprospiraceae bacterium]MBK7370571.1 hypothetical protein [Saprospiraceae bacterium]MBL0113879.1 hypothetical protein [Saprospiraceae bacterium]